MALGGILIALILQQLYFRAKYEGNLVLYISNESLVDSARLEIFVDGKKVLEDKVTNQVTHLYKQYSVKTTLGNHAVVIKVAGESSEEIKLNTFLVTFVSVDYYGDRLDVPGSEDGKHFSIDTEKFPMIFIS